MAKKFNVTAVCMPDVHYMVNIDDRLEIDEVWNICEALVRRGRLEEEDWELSARKS